MKKKLVIVTGLSGAGKSSVMVAFEHLGYKCMDNYPVALIDYLIDYIETDTYLNYVALAIPLSEAKQVFYRISNTSNFELSMLFLDASIDTLVSRYQFTRRVHPLVLLQKANTLEEAIDIEKELGQEVRHEAIEVIDTSGVTIKQLEHKIRDLFNKDNNDYELTISFVSFGYRYGLPKDSDFIFDMRSLPNPFYDETLKNKTGLDQEVYDFVLKQDQTKAYLQMLIPFLDTALEQIKTSGKHHLIISIGCTGGQHRSVSIARYLQSNYATQFVTYINHRDFEKR